MTYRFWQKDQQRRQKRQTFDSSYDYDPNYEDIYDEYDIDYGTRDFDTPDTVDPGENPFPVAALAEGPLPQLVTLDIDLKYDRSLLNYFNGDRDKVREFITRVIHLARPHLRHHSLGVMVDLNFVGDIELLEATVKASEEDIRSLVPQFENQDRLVSIFATEIIPGQRSTRQAKATTGIAARGAACRTGGIALSITELAFLRKDGQPHLLQTSKTFAHEVGHNLGIFHDHAAKHGGQRGSCNGKGLMSYGVRRPRMWSSCSKSDFEGWYRKEGYTCLEAKEVPKESKPAGQSNGTPVGPETFTNCSNKLTTKDSPSKGKTN